MRSLKFIILLLSLTFNSVHAQLNRKYGLGYQIINPTSGFTGKMVMSDHVSTQVILGVIGGSTSYPGIAMMNLSGRAIYRLRSQEKGIIPYSFLGVGALLAQGKGHFGSVGGIRDIAPGWHGGAGLEFFPFKKYGFNIEYVYGAINIDDRYYAKNEAAIWFGFHYYFEKFKK